MDEPRANTARDRVLALLIPVVALAIAMLAIVRFHTVDQSSWQGVGFGMFATHEYTPSRTLRATAVADGIEKDVAVPRDLRDEVERVLTAPGDTAIRDLAATLRDRLGADAVTVEVWSHDVDGTAAGLAIGWRRLVTVRTP